MNNQIIKYHKKRNSLKKRNNRFIKISISKRSSKVERNFVHFLNIVSIYPKSSKETWQDQPELNFIDNYFKYLLICILICIIYYSRIFINKIFLKSKVCYFFIDRQNI